MKLNDFVARCHGTAVTKGWWEKPRPKTELYMLMVSEIAEASECVRKDEPPLHFGINTFSGAPANLLTKRGDKFYFIKADPAFNTGKPEGETVELADLLIRLGDYIGSKGWDLQAMIEDLHPEFRNRTINGITQAALNNPKDDSLSLLEDITLCSKLENHFGLVRLLVHGSHLAAGIANEKECLGGLFLFTAAYFAYNAWDLQEILTLKMNYNDTRSYRHGGKLA